MIELKEVIKMYENGRRAINGIDLNVHKGESILIVGAAGSGKGTLLKLISGIQAPSAGSICVDGQAVHTLDSDSAADFRNRTFGILTRKQAFADNITVIDNVALPLALRKTPGAERIKAAKQQMAFMDIGHKADAYPPRLSLLEKHLSGIARALITEPQVLLLYDFGVDLSAKDYERVRGILCAILNFSEVTAIRFTNKENDGLPVNRKLHLENGKLVEG